MTTYGGVDFTQGNSWFSGVTVQQEIHEHLRKLYQRLVYRRERAKVVLFLSSLFGNQLFSAVAEPALFQLLFFQLTPSPAS